MYLALVNRQPCLPLVHLLKAFASGAAMNVQNWGCNAVKI